MKLFSKKGFTLIELLIVVAIIAILAAIAVPNFLEAQTRSKVSRSKADMRSMATAAEAYAVDHNKYPSNAHDGVLDFDFLKILTPLSTPIAYITDAHIPDAFGNIAYPDLGGNFVYFFFSLHPEEQLIQDAYIGALTYPQDAINVLIDSRYAIIGCGPDRIAEFHWIAQPFGSTNDTFEQINHEGYVFTVGGDGFYDPTNGTISKGDILRTGRGIEERKRLD